MFSCLYAYAMSLIALMLIIGGIIFSFSSRFVQFRMLADMCVLFWNNCFVRSKKQKGVVTISANNALFTSMATSIGLGNIIGPLVAIKAGGPGALLGFVIATVLGSATMYTEVTAALSFRKKVGNQFSGGPMGYIAHVFSSKWAKLYALFASLLLLSWTASQVNVLADLLTCVCVSRIITGIVLTLLTVFLLIGGITRVSEFASKAIPVLFVCYSVVGLGIIGYHYDQIIPILKLIWLSAFKPQAVFGAATGYGLVLALRWGLCSGLYCNEAGCGVSTIAHSASAANDPQEQGVLSMISVYSNGFLCAISGMILLITGAWSCTVGAGQASNAGIGMMWNIFYEYFSTVGALLFLLCAILFSLTTILGNSYNGERCFLYLTNMRYARWYLVAIAIVIAISALVSLDIIWHVMNIILLPMVLINTTALLKLVYQGRKGKA